MTRYVISAEGSIGYDRDAVVPDGKGGWKFQPNKVQCSEYSLRYKRTPFSWPCAKGFERVFDVKGLSQFNIVLTDQKPRSLDNVLVVEHTYDATKHWAWDKHTWLTVSHKVRELHGLRSFFELSSVPTPTESGEWYIWVEEIA